MRCATHDYEYQFGIGKCPYCEAEERARRAEEQAEELEKRREKREEESEQRRRDLDASRDEKEENWHWEEIQRQEDATAARDAALERAADRREEQNAAFLERQKEQLANQWRYAAESKLTQARNLFDAGAYDPALALAEEAKPLGLEAFQLMGWIHKARGNIAQCRELLLTQIGFLRMNESIPNFTSHRERILREILELGGANDSLVAAYFESAKEWCIFPYNLHSLLQSSGLLASSAYKKMVLREITLGLGEYGKGLPPILPELLSIPDNESLVAEYVKSVEARKYFPFESIDWLLAQRRTDLANELFKGKFAVVDEGSVEFLWRVCPLGVELSAQGKQDGRWCKKLKAALEQTPFSDTFAQGYAPGFARVMASNGIGDATKKKLRELTLDACKKKVAGQSAGFYKQFVTAAVKGGLAYDGIRGPTLFAALWVIAVILLLWKISLIAAGVVALLFYMIALPVRRRSNARHIAAGHQSERLRAEATKVARALSLNDTETKSMLLGFEAPSYVPQTVNDFLIVSALAAITLVAFYLVGTNTESERREIAESTEWTQDWTAATGQNDHTVRLVRDKDGRLALMFHDRNFLGMTSSNARASVHLQRCTKSSTMVSCDATTNIAGRKEYEAIPGRLDLDLGKRSGILLQSPAGEPPLRTTLNGTPSSLSGAPNDLLQEQAKTSIRRSPALSATTPTTAPEASSVTMVQDARTGCNVGKPDVAPNDAVTWSGDCKSGFAQGPGTAQWSSNGMNTLMYEGTFRSGLLQGWGTMTTAGGDRYDGEYRNGMRGGRGAYTTAKGERYEGEYKDNKRNGYGVVTRADGSRFAGMFKDGKALVPDQEN